MIKPARRAPNTRDSRPTNPQSGRRHRFLGRRAAPGSSRVAVALCSIAAIIVAIGVGAEPALAKNSTRILLKDPLSTASPAMAGATTPGDGYVGSFTSGKFLLQNTGTHTQSFAPTFDATAAQLSAISVDINVSLANAKSTAGLNCREGNTIDTRYVFLVGAGGWVVGKSLYPANTPLRRGSIKIPPNHPVHLRIECSGPGQPGPTGTVTGKFFINGKKVATITDSKSALPVTLPATLGMEVEPMGAASFSKITVAQL
jgi:hypothetical protein